MALLSTKIASLVRRIFQMTQEENLRWAETGRDGVYQVAIADYVVRIIEEPGTDPKTAPHYALRICNAQGLVLEEISSEDLAERVADAQEYLRDIYVRARRIALDVETAIDRILRELEDAQPN